MEQKIRIPMTANSRSMNLSNSVAVAAVSYTHLDVYKRQSRYHSERAISAPPKRPLTSTLIPLAPVSYTHLDVYKRQV